MQNTEDISDSLSDLEDENDLSTVCRTCAATTESLIPIFEGEGLRRNLADKINKFLPIKVSPQDALPLRVCRACADTLVRAHMLARAARRADARLRARLARRAHPRTHTPPTRKRKATATTNTEENSNSQQQDKWNSCWRNFTSVTANSEINWSIFAEETFDIKSEVNSDRDSQSFDEDDEPLSNVAASKRTDQLYKEFYGALVNFRNHFISDHSARKCNYPDFTDSSDTAAEHDEGDADEVDIDNFDDLTKCNMRKDRMDEETRRELSQVQTRVNGKAYYACTTCGKNLSSAHTYVYHKRIHTGERPCICHVCGKQFRAPNGLQRHLAETHERARRHPCRYCPKNFANSQNLKQHVRIHTGERPYVCAQCGKRFTQSGSLHAHLKTHSAHFPHECADCGAKFRLRGGLARHRLRHSGVRPHACACGRAFRQRHELRAHALVHAGHRPHVCALCGAAFRQRRALRLHARRLHPAPPPPYPSTHLHHPPQECAPTAAATVTRRTCPYCSLDWPDDAYKDHLLNAHANLLFLCDECDTYVDRKELITHMSLHAIQYDRIAAMRAAEKRRNETNTTPNKNDTCPDEMKARPNETNPTESNEPETDTCQNENVPVERSDQENRNVDSGTETSVADEPQENEFSDRSDSECKFGPLPDSVFEAIEDSQDAPRAARSAAASRKRERTCPICAKTYTASSSYFYHMKHQHGDSREHECAQCGRRFGTRAGLAQHAPVHTGERRHECAQCGKRFASRAGLYVHARTHAAGAARRWQCADCGRGFAWRQALARHERRHAGAEGRAHGCNACGRRFAARYDLSRHARTHTPAALPCRYCAATFAQPRYLQVHMRRKHPAYTTATNT